MDPARQDRPDTPTLEDAYTRVRGFTEELCRPLTAEDACLQSMPDVSPTKWHLAHTTWFFETFVLGSFARDFEPDPVCRYLFNSYYEAVGERHPRPERGLLSRPSLDEVRSYRARIDGEMSARLRRGELPDEALSLVELGLHHEQQHQELILTDIKHVFSRNPLRPALAPQESRASASSVPDTGWVDFSGGLFPVGHDGTGFHFDNEAPRHRVFLEPFRLGTRLVTNGEYRAFLEDEGYDRPDLWLSDGWDTVRREGWQAPLYWEEREGAWWLLTLSGMRPVEDAEPVCHVSYYEADAFARWSGARLPTEAEWETAAAPEPVEGNFVESRLFHPAPPGGNGRPRLRQAFGDVWEWTSSAYLAYPGFRPAPGAVGEYNGKFMCNQFVLRGGSCATPRSHVRATYRNFFPPAVRWQFTGIRLAT